jgi:hypothetical protein
MVVATTYERVLNEPLLARAGECLRVDWTLSLNLPAGAYEVGHHLAGASGDYHDFQATAALSLCVMTRASSRVAMSVCRFDTMPPDASAH